MIQHHPVASPDRLSVGRAFVLALVAWLLVCSSHPAWAQLRLQSATTNGVAPAAATEQRIDAISPADIPARADADEQFIQAVLRRTQATDASKRFERSLAAQFTAVQQLAHRSASIDLSLFPERRLESLLRHWLLYERQLASWRSDLQRATKLSSDDAASLASRRAVWQATRVAASGSPNALMQRADDLINQIDRAETLLSAPLGKMLELGRKANALWAQVEAGVATTRLRAVEQDRELGLIDAPPLWQALSEAGALESVDPGLTRSLQVEIDFERDYDAANARAWRLLAACALLLLPLMLWLRRRAARLVADGDNAEPLGALSRPWAAWLVLVALGAVLYDWQGPTLRQQVVMLLAWVPVLRLLSNRVLAIVGPWATLSAVFYFLIMVASLFIGNHFWYRCLLLAVDVLMLLTLLWMAVRVRPPLTDPIPPVVDRILRVLALAAAGSLLVAVASNVVGNVSLASMLTSAVLASNYVALAMLAGARALLALFRLLLPSPTVSRLRDSGRRTGSLIQASTNVGRTLIAVAWLIYSLQVFRVYQPLVAWMASILQVEFALGELSITLGGVVSLIGTGWLAFWLAKTIRLVLAEDLLPSLSLPRGVDNTISTLTYYSVLFVGLMAAMAAAGFKIGQLTIVLGALSVGIGFGLQDIVKNFVAGLVLMFERPIQPGDIVDVAGMSGTVRDIGMRATTLSTFDGADVVVPNGMLLADKLVNWTLSGPRRRFDIVISTGYGAPPRRTIELLTRIARDCGDVCSSPEPTAILTGLAPGALEFSLRAWTNRDDWVIVRSDLAVKLHDELAAAGIEVPLPQRDLHLRTVSPDAARELSGIKAAPS